ncbi:BrnA antitoxin family protein [bacterium]
MTISKKRLNEIRDIKEEDIDYSDIPELDDDWFEKATLIKSQTKAVSVKLDNDVVEWYRSHDRNYQARINAILRAYMNKHKAHA